MKKIILVVWLLAVSVCAVAVEDGQVMYVGGTVEGAPAGAIGKLDTSSPTILVYQYSSAKLVIPYAAIESYEYSYEVTRHLGFLPAVAVGLFRHRQHRHFFRIAYHEEGKPGQVVLLEVPKGMPPMLKAVLELRAPQGCDPKKKCVWSQSW